MSNWSAGYTAEVDYTYGYYEELNPLRMQLAFLKNGLLYPQVSHACELGYGQGLSTNIHAAASSIEWHGTDFNPGQASFARELAQASGAHANLVDKSFEAFAARTDLPGFDFIGIHGIWSWISDENRSHIVDFINRKLNVGGVVYISYNTLPAWSAFIPLRKLMLEHSRRMTAQGMPLKDRIGSALEFAQQLIDTNSSHFKVHPVLAERIKKMGDQSPEYLAHEFFNEDWEPMDFSDLTEWLEPAKLTFACSSTPYDHVDALSLTPEQRAVVDKITDPTFRQTTRDVLVNQQFRRDYWVKGPRKHSILSQSEAFKAQRVILSKPSEEIDFKIKSSAGEATLSEAVYKPVIAALSDHKPVSVEELMTRLEGKDVNLAQLLEALTVAMGAGYIAPAQGAVTVKAAKTTSDKLNAYLCANARANNDIKHMTSPVTGGGVVVDRFERIFLLAIEQGLKKPAEWAEFAWQLLSSQGQLMIKDGKTLESAEENIAAHTVAAEKFKKVRLPLLKSLGVV
jgi:hypothetical protein